MKVILRVLLIAALFSEAYAQKLPNVQQVSLRAPANIKIDGKATECDDKFAAYNGTTQVYYTISNDDDLLYLTLKATDFTTIKKILAAGIILTINPQNKKKDSTITTAVSFPYYSTGQQPMSISAQLAAKSNLNKIQLDSFATEYNRQIPAHFKLIGVQGANGIKDTFVSIYNEDGIKVAAAFNKDMSYICELALPLKLLGDKAGPSTFNYNLQINGQTTFNGYAITPVQGRSNLLTFTDDKGTRFMLDQDAKDLYYPTDFWGEYTLAK